MNKTQNRPPLPWMHEVDRLLCTWTQCHYDSGSGLRYMMWWCISEYWRQYSSLYHTLIVYLAGASVAAELSVEATGASAVLTSAVWCTTAWGRSSSETAVVVSASITVVIVAVLSACAAGAAVVPGATASAVLKLNHDRSNHTTIRRIPEQHQSCC